MHQWIQPSPVPMPDFGQELYKGYPYVTGSAFYTLADFTWSTHYPWLRGIVYNDTFEPRAVPNRSLVFWNLNRNGPDLGWLKHRIAEFRSHFFLITHLMDEIHLPPWLLDNPLVLKVCPPHSTSTVSGLRPHPLPQTPPPRKSSSCCAAAQITGNMLEPVGMLFLRGMDGKACV